MTPHRTPLPWQPPQSLPGCWCSEHCCCCCSLPAVRSKGFVQELCAYACVCVCVCVMHLNTELLLAACSAQQRVCTRAVCVRVCVCVMHLNTELLLAAYAHTIRGHRQMFVRSSPLPPLVVVCPVANLLTCVHNTRSGMNGMQVVTHTYTHTQLAEWSCTQRHVRYASCHTHIHTHTQLAEWSYTQRHERYASCYTHTQLVEWSYHCHSYSGLNCHSFI